MAKIREIVVHFGTLTLEAMVKTINAARAG